jgi:hypothetical protein
MKPTCFFSLLLLSAFSFIQELSKPDLQKKLKDTAVHPEWIYDDLPAAFAAAAKSGKPILAIFRCVP